MRWMTWRAISARPLAKALRLQRQWARQVALESEDPVDQLPTLYESGMDEEVGTTERHRTRDNCAASCSP